MNRIAGLPGILLLCAIAGVSVTSNAAAAANFKVEEATISDIHDAIKAGTATCKSVVQAYIARAKAYNGVCTALVTADGKSIKPGKGYVRAGAPLVFPTKTVKASTVFPDLDKYAGVPLDYGRMEPTVSDPSVPASLTRTTCSLSSRPIARASRKNRSTERVSSMLRSRKGLAIRTRAIACPTTYWRRAPRYSSMSGAPCARTGEPHMIRARTNRIVRLVMA